MGGVAAVAFAVVGGVDVEAAVGLAQRPDVGAHLLLVEEPVEPDQVGVAAARGDRRRGYQLVAVVAVVIMVLLILFKLNSGAEVWQYPLAFLIGASFSAAAGYVGMNVAVRNLPGTMDKMLGLDKAGLN